MIKGTENLPIGDLISRRVPFRIPIYQRAYAWERDEIEDFINDLLSLYQARKKSTEMKHFFGGIVSVERFAGNTYTGRTFEVVKWVPLSRPRTLKNKYELVDIKHGSLSKMNLGRGSII